MLQRGKTERTQERCAMFTAGELVVYGGEGVCCVEGVGPSCVPGTDKKRLYYTLRPLSRSGQVITPVDTRVLMRRVMSREEALALIAELNCVPAEEPAVSSPRGVKEHYQQIVTSYDCRRMVGLIRAVAAKRRRALEQGKKVSQMDERYLKRAEDQLYGELAAALDLERKQVADYIRCTFPQWPEI